MITLFFFFSASHAGINDTFEQTSDCYATLVAANFDQVGQDIYTATSCNMGRCLCPHTHIMRQNSFPPLCGEYIPVNNTTEPTWNSPTPTK